MKKTNIAILFILLISETSCRPGTATCKLNEIKTLFTTEGVYEGKVTGYAHYILVKGFLRECMDSAMMVNIALKYIDTIKAGKPATVLKFFSTDKDFIPNETSQDMALINKNCLVDMSIDKNRRPNSFLFFNEKGENVYWGDRWANPSVRK